MFRTGFASRAMPRLAVWVLLCAVFLLLIQSGKAQTSEFRAFWVDAFHPGFKTSAEVTSLINNIRKANCNAVVVEVRKRGDAYYTPNAAYADYEPHATDTSPSNFDSLADLITKAHDTSAGKRRIEVHAWLVTWPIWGSSTSFPADPQHPYNRHPEWLTRDITGATWNGSQYCFDPGHPGAAEHTFRIAINVVTNYDLDGLNFDYVRYAGNTWGYNATAVNRFRARFGGSGNPANTNANWLQFRRDQVTAFMRKVYLVALANKPIVKVSADTITWSPGPASDTVWYNSSAAWNNVLQDWRGWMQEGILDLNMPMAYFDQSGLYTVAWTNWCNFIRDHQYNRQAVIGPGIYLNSTADAITQIRFTRALSPSGNSVRGFCGYSYAVPDKAGTSFGNFLDYLTNSPNSFDTISPAVFAQPATVPDMAWKTAPTKGHLMGTVFGGTPTSTVDGAIVFLSGSVSRTQTNDGSGFYGFVDLPPGDYIVSGVFPGLGTATNTVTISAGAVRTSNLVLSTNVLLPPVIQIQPQDQTIKVSSNATFSVVANGSSPLSYQWFFNTAPLPTATTNSFTRVSAQPTHQGLYTVLITNAAGSVTSNPALLTVVPLQPPLILVGPTSQAAVPGGNASFAVEVSSPSSPRFQWRFNGDDLPGRNAQALALAALQPADFGLYSVRVDNDDGTVTSDPAALTTATRPQLVPGRNGGTNVTLAFLTEPGPLYNLEFVTGMETADWKTLTNVAGSGSSVLVSDPIATNALRLYRLRLQ